MRPLKYVSYLGAGWDNSVYLINKKIIFRFPHRFVAAPLIENENKFLPKIVGQTELLTPELKYIGKPCKDYPFVFHGYEKIDGVSSCHAKLSKAERIASIAPLAKFLKRLHGLDKAKVMPDGEWTQTFNRSSPEFLAERLQVATDSAQKKGPLKFNQREYDREYKKALAINLTNEDRVVLHGDLYCRHLIFKDSKLHGIIDWGDNGVGLRGVDLAVLFSFYPMECHEQFFAIYGAVSKETYYFARFAAIHSATNILIYGQAIEDGLLFKEAANAIFRINDKLVNL